MSRWDAQSHSVWSTACHLESLKPPEFRKHASLLFPSQSPWKEAQHKDVLTPVGCSTPAFLWRRAWNEGSENGKMSLKTNMIHWHLLLAQPRILYWIFCGKQNWYQTNIRFLWADWLQPYSEKSLLKTAQLGSSLPTWFLTELERVAWKWPHT